MIKEPTIEEHQARHEKAMRAVGYLQMPNQPHCVMVEKYMGLRSCGYSKEQADKLCKPIEYDREQVRKDVAEIMRKERRALARENTWRHRTPTAAELHALPDFSNCLPLKPNYKEPHET